MTDTLENTETKPEPPQPTTALIPKPKREILNVQDESPIAYLMDTARFEHCYRIAGAMARASLIPRHLKGDSYEQTQANCFLVVNQALRWQLDPFAIAPETYEVGGKLAFQGKLIAAVINARAGLAERLSYTFEGKGDALTITVSGRLLGEETPRVVQVSVAQARTENKMWTRDPEQKLVYTGSIRWARRHKPEIILGVLTDDDADAIREEMRLIAAKPAKRPEPTALQKALTQTVESPPMHFPEPTGHTKPTLAAGAAAVTGGSPTETPSPGQSASPPDNGGTPSQREVNRLCFKGRAGESPTLTELRRLLFQSNKTEEELLDYGRRKNWAKEGQKLSDLSETKLKSVVANWDNLHELNKEAK